MQCISSLHLVFNWLNVCNNNYQHRPCYRHHDETPTVNVCCDGLDSCQLHLTSHPQPDNSSSYLQLNNIHDSRTSEYGCLCSDGYRMYSAETNAKTMHILQQELEEKQCITQTEGTRPMCTLVGDGKPIVFFMHNLPALKQTMSAYAVGIKLDIRGPAYGLGNGWPPKKSLVQKVKRSQTVCAILKFYSVHNGKNQILWNHAMSKRCSKLNQFAPPPLPPPSSPFLRTTSTLSFFLFKRLIFPQINSG